MNKIIPVDVLYPNAKFVAIRVSDTFEYINNVKTNNVIGKSVKLVNIASKDFENLLLKVEDVNCPVSQEMIDSTDGQIIVELVNGTCRFYVDRNNNLAVSVRADKLTIVPAKK